jgi:VWFA-related protein
MSRHHLIITLGLFAILGGLGLKSALAPAAPRGAQQPSAPALPNPTTVIKVEANLVLVDAIVTDKKGNYIHDIEQKEFHVFEDDAEQPITSFSRAADIQPNAPEQRRYMVLYFDDSTMEAADQMRARDAAGKFVASTASPNCLVAVAEFSGVLRIAQNFTADGNRLKAAVSQVKFAALNPNAAPQVELASIGAPSLGIAQSDFAARSMLLSIRELAKELRAVPGRKTLILFSSGFALTSERQAELTATVDALNKANVAVYPVDVRGLIAAPTPVMDITNPGGRPGLPPGAFLHEPGSSFPHQPGLLATLAFPGDPEPQRGGGGGGGVGGGTGGTSGGTGGAGGGGGGRGGTGGTGGTSGTGGGGRGGTGGKPTSGSTGNTNPGRGGSNPNTNPINPNNLNNNPQLNPSLCNGPMAYQYPSCGNRGIIPTMPDNVATNQQVLYALASGTGGFPIFNTNDLLAGLEKVAKDMKEYYILGYVPPNQAHDGSFHKIKVTVDRKGVEVRSRTGYFDVRSPDLLAGKPEGKTLEERVAAPAQPGDIPVSLTAPYFYAGPGVARVNLSLSIPGSSIDFEKDKSNFHSQVNVLGIAYRENGSVAARFSDTVKVDLEKKGMKDFNKGSFDYQNSFNIAPGKYTLKLALSAGGQKFGKYEMPLVVDPFTGNELTLGGPALSSRVVPVSQLTVNMDAALLEEQTPLVFAGNQVFPSPNNRFEKSGQSVFYVEVFDPLLQTEAPRVGILFNIVNKKTNQQVFASNTILVNELAQPGNPLVPFGYRIPVDQLQAGDYRLEVRGRDSAGHASAVRTADFSVE